MRRVACPAGWHRSPMNPIDSPTRATEVVFDLGVLVPVVIEVSGHRGMLVATSSMPGRCEHGGSVIVSTEVRIRTSVARPGESERLNKLRCHPGNCFFIQRFPSLESRDYGQPALKAARKAATSKKSRRPSPLISASHALGSGMTARMTESLVMDPKLFVSTQS